MKVIFRLAWRNLLLNLSRRLVILIVVSVSIALLLLGNTILSQSDESMEQSYRDSFTADFVIAQQDADPFNLFGSTVPLVGDQLGIPILQDKNRVRFILETHPGVESFTGQVSTPGQLELNGVKVLAPLFGIDFPEWKTVFPEVALKAGQIPEQGQEGLVFSTESLGSFEAALGRKLEIGERILITMSTRTSYVIRELPFLGVVDLLANDDLSKRIVFIDSNTARSLAGLQVYVEESPELDAATESLLSGDLDAMFNEPLDEVYSVPSGESLVPGEIATEVFDDPDPAWHFYLVRLHAGADLASAISQIEEKCRAAGLAVQVLPWRSAAGGMAELVVIIKIIFNFGMLFVLAAVALVIVNTITLATMDRTKEIGTMRAVGAQKSMVALVVSGEIVMLMALAGIFAIIWGTLFMFGINGLRIPNDNAVFRSLFGSGTLVVHPSIQQTLFHGVLALGLGVLASLPPLRLALNVAPVRAMQRD